MQYVFESFPIRKPSEVERIVHRLMIKNNNAVDNYISENINKEEFTDLRSMYVFNMIGGTTKSKSEFFVFLNFHFLDSGL